MARRVSAALSGEKAMEYSKWKDAATRRIVDGLAMRRVLP
jgi:hypothetical protein